MFCHNTLAEAINDLSATQVVGWNEDTNHPLLWKRNPVTGAWTVIDLDVAICDCQNQWQQIVQAHDVNDSGWIVGFGEHPGIRAFLLRPVEECPGDLDGNGHVNGADVSILLANLGPCTNCADLCCACIGDINGDCRRNQADYNAIIGSFGPCPGFGTCVTAPSSAQALEEAVAVLGFQSVADYQAWIAEASDEAFFISGQALLVLLWSP